MYESVLNRLPIFPEWNIGIFGVKNNAILLKKSKIRLDKPRITADKNRNRIVFHAKRPDCFARIGSGYSPFMFVLV